MRSAADQEENVLEKKLEDLASSLHNDCFRDDAVDSIIKQGYEEPIIRLALRHIENNIVPYPATPICIWQDYLFSIVGSIPTEKTLTALIKAYNQYAVEQDAFRKECGSIGVLEALVVLAVAERKYAERVLTVLQNACIDPAPNIRGKAVNCLGRVIGVIPHCAPRVLQTILHIHDRDCQKPYSPPSYINSFRVDVNEAVICSLRHLVKAAPTNNVREELIKACSSPSILVQKSAVTALSVLVERMSKHADKIVGVILQVFSDEENDIELRDTAARALIASGGVLYKNPDRVFCALLKVGISFYNGDSTNTEIRRDDVMKAIGKLAKENPKHADTILEAVCKLTQGHDKKSVMFALSTLSDLVKIAFLEKDVRGAINALLRACGSHDAEIRDTAFCNLGYVARAVSTRHILNRLLQACKSYSPFIRCGATRALVWCFFGAIAAEEKQLEKERKRDIHLIRKALMTASSDPDKHVRIEAIRGLCGLAEKTCIAADEVFKIAQQEPDPEARFGATLSLMKLTSKQEHAQKLKEAFNKACSDSDKRVRNAGIAGLFLLATEVDDFVANILVTLSDIARKDPDSETRSEAIQKLKDFSRSKPQYQADVRRLLPESSGSYCALQ